MTREEGLFAGGSSGLITSVALNVAREVNDPNAFVVSVLCDTGERYLSKLYSDEWMRENQMLDAQRLNLHHVLGRKNSGDGGSRTVISVAPGASVRQALGLMSLHDVSQLPVMDAESCVGSVSDWSLSQKSLENAKLLEQPVSEGDGIAVSDRHVGTAGGIGGEAALEIESGGAGSGQRRDSGNNHPIGHARFRDVTMKVTVLLGGTSAERNVSLASGIRIVQALRSRGHEVIALDPARGVMSASEERRLSESAVGTEPPSLEALSKVSEGAFLPTLTTMPEVSDADVIFLALHGGQGEDGTIQALLDMAGRDIPEAVTSPARWRWTRTCPRNFFEPRT